MSTTENKVYFPLRIWQLAWYVAIFVVGFLGNTLVIYLAFKRTKIKTGSRKNEIDRKAPFNVYLISLAIVDLLISIFGVPVYLLSTELFPHPTGVPGEILCKIVTGYFFPFWMLDISAFLLVAIALERRRAIVHPFTKLQETNLCHTLLIVFGIVLLSMVTQAPTIYGSHFVAENASIGNSCTYSYDNLLMKILHYNSFTLECIIPVIIFIVCFGQIYKQLSKKSSSLTTSLVAYKDSEIYQEKVRNAFKRTSQTVNTMRLVVIAFLVCVVVNEVFFMLLKPVLRVTTVQWNSQIYQFTVMLRFTNSCINPILYGFKSQVFRKRFKETFLGVFSTTTKIRPPKSPPVLCSNVPSPRPSGEGGNICPKLQSNVI